MTNKSSKKLDGQNASAFWKKVLGILEVQLNPMTFKTWVLKIHPENIKEEKLFLAVPSPYTKKQLQKFLSLIQDAVNKVANQEMTIKFTINENLNGAENKDNLGPLFEKNKIASVDAKKMRLAGLSPYFTFENFIMGNSNQLAYAIALSVTENPGKNYNPFFLYSDVGLGKTHLIQAIGNRLLQNKPKLNVVYTTGESFTNELVEAIQSGKGRGKYATNEFRKKFRTADVLIIDDIQFIIGRDSTQQEFFHTFNALYMAGKQIVLTSDRPPKDFTKLEKRITSRFASGIIADIQAPDIDVRTAILRTKRDLQKDTIPNSVVDFIAQKIDTNIRELEAAYLQVKTELYSKGITPTIEAVEAVLNKSVDITPKKHVNTSQILKAVCKYYSVKSIDVKGKRRTKEIVLPRQVAMYLIKEYTGMPYMGIGNYLGGRDHTTIMHGVEKIEKEVKQVGKLRQDIYNVKQMI